MISDPFKKEKESKTLEELIKDSFSQRPIIIQFPDVVSENVDTSNNIKKGL